MYALGSICDVVQTAARVYTLAGVCCCGTSWMLVRCLRSQRFACWWKDMGGHSWTARAYALASYSFKQCFSRSSKLVLHHSRKVFIGTARVYALASIRSDVFLAAEKMYGLGSICYVVQTAARVYTLAGVGCSGASWARSAVSAQSKHLAN